MLYGRGGDSSQTPSSTGKDDCVSRGGEALENARISAAYVSDAKVGSIRSMLCAGCEPPTQPNAFKVDFTKRLPHFNVTLCT